MKLEAEHITYVYPGREEPTVTDVSFCVSGNERVGIFAPSGYGKTTLCQIVAGYRRPAAGRVLLDGQALPSKGYCPVQMIWQHPEKAVNPRVKMRNVLREGDGIDARIMRGLGIEEDWCNRYPQELSGGELQRFCIARALGAGTKFLIADEISTMLDLITQSQIWEFLLQETHDRGIGMLVVSHDHALLEQVCTRKMVFAKPKTDDTYALKRTTRQHC